MPDSWYGPLNVSVVVVAELARHWRWMGETKEDHIFFIVVSRQEPCDSIDIISKNSK